MGSEALAELPEIPPKVCSAVWVFPYHSLSKLDL